MSASDPLAPGSLAERMGSAALGRGRRPRWDLGEIVAYNSATLTSVVRTHTGRVLRNVPQLRPSPNDFDHLKVGTIVAVHYELGFPVIEGVLTIPGPLQDIIVRPSITGLDGVGNDNPLQPTEGDHDYAPPAAPSDLTQGDWARTGALGNYVAVLEGGVSAIGSPNAFVRSLGLIGLLQLVAKRIKTVTDFGEWSVTNDQGRTSFTLRAGSSQTTQTGLDESHWTIRLDIGATGDLFDFQITDTQGKVLFRFSVGSDGRFQLYGDGGADISSGPNADAETRSDIVGARTTSIRDDDTHTVQGNHVVTVGKAQTQSIGTDKKTGIGNDEARYINQNQTISVGGKKTEVIAGGSPLTAIPGTLAYEVKVANGGYMIDIGNPLDGANMSALASFRVRTSLGDIGLESGGALQLHARQNVDLAGLLVSVNGDTHPLPLWDVYLGDEASFLSTLIALIQGGVAVAGPTAGQFNLLPASIATLQRFATLVATGTPYQSVKARNG
jgi:hypothetical protein